MTEIDWNNYVKTSSEVVPDSLSMHLMTSQTRLTVCEESPYIVQSIRYRTPEDIYFFFQVKGREYGDWKLYEPSGLVIVSPKLMLYGKEVFLCFRDVKEPFDLSLDVERLRKV